MPDLILPYHWSPRPYQQPLWDYLTGGGLRAVQCAHRRWGKDEVALHWTACAAHIRIGNYAHMLPQYAQARKAIWDAVNPHTGMRRIDEAFPLALRADPGGTLDQEMKIRFKNGSSWQVVGADTYNALMGTSYAGIVKSEEALSDPAAWAYLAPILRENGGWVVFISTMRGRNHFHKLIQTAQQTPGWYGHISSNDDTHRLSEAELAEERQMYHDLHGQDFGEAIFQQEYFCSPDAAIPGSVWGDCVRQAEAEGRVRDFAVDPQSPVYTAWDLGRTDDTAIWWYQFVGTKIHILDYFASPFLDIHNPVRQDRSLVHLLLAKREQYGYRYARHILPHDARPRTLAAGGKSILQQFIGWSQVYPELGQFVIGKRLDKQEGIQAARATFPHCVFQKTRTAKGVEALQAYHRVWDDEKKVFSHEPDHDWASHGADAFRYLSLEWKRPTVAKSDAPLMDRLQAQSITAQTFGAMKQSHLSKRKSQREWSAVT